MNHTNKESGMDSLMNSVRNAITDIIAATDFHKNLGGKTAGWFSIPREVFCITDFLGSIAYNNKGNEIGASTRKSVRFLKEFFPKEYKPFANLVIAIWRHGTVHSFFPSIYFVMRGKNKIIVKWTSNRSNEKRNRIVNMNTFDKVGEANTVMLSVNIFQLADDLLSAFDKFLNKMSKKPQFKNGCRRRINNVLKMKNCESLHRIGKGERQILKNQILLAKNSTKGKIDANIQVEWYKPLKRKKS
jgi:hypothetical protein